MHIPYLQHWKNVLFLKLTDLEAGEELVLDVHGGVECVVRVPLLGEGEPELLHLVLRLQVPGHLPQ